MWNPVLTLSPRSLLLSMTSDCPSTLRPEHPPYRSRHKWRYKSSTKLVSDSCQDYQKSCPDCQRKRTGMQALVHHPLNLVMKPILWWHHCIETNWNKNVCYSSCTLRSMPCRQKCPIDAHKKTKCTMRWHHHCQADPCHKAIKLCHTTSTSVHVAKACLE